MEQTLTGEWVSPTTGLCSHCTKIAATDAVYWTDDSRFDALGRGWDAAERFRHLQRAITNQRTACVNTCGRTEVNA